MAFILSLLYPVLRYSVEWYNYFFPRPLIARDIILNHAYLIESCELCKACELCQDGYHPDCGICIGCESDTLVVDDITDKIRHHGYTVNHMYTDVKFDDPDKIKHSLNDYRTHTHTHVIMYVNGPGYSITKIKKPISHKILQD